MPQKSMSFPRKRVEDATRRESKHSLSESNWMLRYAQHDVLAYLCHIRNLRCFKLEHSQPLKQLASEFDFS